MPEITNQLYSHRFDQYNKHWTSDIKNNVLFLLSVQSWANNTLAARGHIFLNEIYDILGFDRTPQGQLVGWFKKPGSNPVDFGIRREVDAETGVVVLTFNPDGVMYNEI